MPIPQTSPCVRPKRMLARHPHVGTVAELRTDMIEIVFEGQAMTIPSGRYWAFMELMSEAARRFVSRAPLYD